MTKVLVTALAAFLVIGSGPVPAHAKDPWKDYRKAEAKQEKAYYKHQGREAKKWEKAERKRAKHWARDGRSHRYGW